MKLIIVESPTKARTIEGFLDKEYQVTSSYGHVRDLPRGNIGVDVDEGTFEPKYVIPTKVRKRVTQLKKLAQKADRIILATDEDREGEAIAWHLIQALELPEDKVDRIVFHEITKDAIQHALAHPRSINAGLVDAQQARRVLDRLVGYKLSPFLWKKIANRLSAGRVQSVAVRLIVDRENEIRAFTSEKYWTIEAVFSDFEAALMKVGDEAFPKPGMKDKKEAEHIVHILKKSDFTVARVVRKQKHRSPLPPFITSTLQQEASRRLWFSARQTMRIAQKLYERGLITYMRTDSTNISKESLQAARAWIKKELGGTYVLPEPRVFKKKSRLAQEAHEAIRPTDPSSVPQSMGGKVIPKLEEREVKLYDLIWRRFIASQLPQALFNQISVDIIAVSDNNEHTLRATGRSTQFDGFLKIWEQKVSTNELPPLSDGDKLTLNQARADEHETEPPPRYNEASLIKVLEEYGIGRPSTYAPIISVIQERNYVERDERRRFQPTEIGEIVNGMLTEHFSQIVDISFTANMEENLDDISQGKKEWKKIIAAFYDPFARNLEKKYEEVEKREFIQKDKETDEKCEKCGKPMVIKMSRFGKFIACTGFPECRNTKSYLDESNTFGDCSDCEDGKIIRRKTKKGRFFYGCSNYPDCKFASWKKPGSEEEEPEEKPEEEVEKPT